ncbi:unnamed protein product [Dovyalis caffra]|uniref:Uncharacterized protein n=1 Tax=Dovyalis caffra TaxID=77055 RepID=A0AAV1SPL0_9ROSI|nr:unnamed protein product [Dovyalis caffra]
MGLKGTVDIDILTQLPNLRTLSFMNNSLDGPMPEVKKLGSLRNFYLSNNDFSGKIGEDAFDGMNSLREVYLAHNVFTGGIPRSLVTLPKLTKLSLEGNRLDGNLPDFSQENLTVFDAADNNFKGQIPTSLSGFSTSSFTGNKGLCGKPLPACKSSKKKTMIIIVVIVVSVVALSAIVAFACIRSRQTKTPKFNGTEKKFAKNGIVQKETQLSDQFGDGKKGDNGQLHFVRYDRERFDLQDLLRASAEVLGNGTFGSSYKAVLLDGPGMVVKRFRHMSNVGKEEFHEHMRKLGTLSHPNLLPLVAYYYRREEKLLVSDLIENGSLASHLHAKRSPGKTWLDWPSRLKIVKGVARDGTFEPLLTDYALVPMVNRDHAQQVMVAYKSPEFTHSDRTTRKTDVWSLGILILEVLTGKFPENYLMQGKGGDADLATWVNSVVREEWTGEVFDMDMMRTKNCEGEMLKLLKIGMCCCEWNLERRWDLKEAVAKIEELKERDNDNDDLSNSFPSEALPRKAYKGREDYQLFLVVIMAGPDSQAKFIESSDFVANLSSRGVDYLLSGEGKVPLLSSCDGKVICLFFSANWCRPCKSFAPQLVKIYNSLRATGNKLEIVFISFDRDEDGFKEHFKCMPWLAVPFEVNLHRYLSDIYHVNRIPSFISLSSDGISVEEDMIGLVEDYGAEAFPFTRKRFEELRSIDDAKRHGGKLQQLLAHEGRNYVLSRDTRKILVSELGGKTIGLYFGAHWCPPSRAFTAQLIQAYSEIITSKDGCFEIILVSTDRDLKEFNTNLSNMPWLAIPYEDRTRQDLCRIFNIKGIPALVIIGQDGKIISTDGKAIISLYGAKAFPFTESRITEIEAALEKEGDALPRQVKDKKHQHALKLDMAKAYVCDCCKGQGKFWAFSCDVCDYDLHPACVEEACSDS